MGKRNNIYRLEDMVEYDEAFVGKAVNNRNKSKLKHCKEVKKWLLWLNPQYFRTLTRVSLKRAVGISR
ncbi:hypothetical protein CLV48_102418 [Cecembia rubra]|uniref:Uncharacterized protein n=1 Tax=Cecembia rubra TaxID=1485585 RepID=A0A2P8EAX3_9BACT|nr:hypothetical protein CLV48_102418 [Cecembia rubra]